MAMNLFGPGQVGGGAVRVRVCVGACGIEGGPVVDLAANPWFSLIVALGPLRSARS